MKKSLILLAAILLATGLMVSCSSSSDDDVDSSLQGTWKAVDPGGFGVDILMILGSDSFEMDIYTTGTATQIDGNKGDLVAKNGVFTTTTKFEWNAGSWDAITPVPSTDTYVLSGNTLTITADFDPGTPGKETVTFTKQ